MYLTQQHVKLSRSCCDFLDLLPFLKDLESTDIPHTLDLWSCFIDLLCLLFSDTLDVEHILLGTYSRVKLVKNDLPHENRKDCAQSCWLQFPNVCCIDTVLFKPVNLIEGWLHVIVFIHPTDCCVRILEWDLLLLLCLLLFFGLFHWKFVMFKNIKSD